MCPNKRAQQALCLDLQHLPTPLLSAVFLRLDAPTQAAFSSTCRALRTAGLHTLGRSLVSRTLVPRAAKGQVSFEVAPPTFLGMLPLLRELTLELDASAAPGAAPADVLCALRAMLACLPHCRGGRSGHSASGGTTAGPRLRLWLRVALPQGVQSMPVLGASQLEQLLLELGLLAGLEALELDSPGFCLDGGLSGILHSAHLVAEQQPLAEETLATVAPYVNLRRLCLGFSGPSGLLKLGMLAARGGFPVVRQLKLAWQPAGELRELGQELLAEEPPSARSPAADLAFLQSLAHLTSLELLNFSSLGSPAAAHTPALPPSPPPPLPQLLPALPLLPSLRSLALTQETWARQLPTFRPANEGGVLAAALAAALPGLWNLQVDEVADDAGFSALKGLTSLAITQASPAAAAAAGSTAGGATAKGASSSGSSSYCGFRWETCQLERLQELCLRGGQCGWLSEGAGWQGLLQPKGIPFSGLRHLRHLVFDVRGWGPSLPDQPALESLLATALASYVTFTSSLTSLLAMHAVLEDGPYSPSRNEGYLAAEGALGHWGAVYDVWGRPWVALLIEEQSPRVVLMQQLAAVGAGALAGAGREAAEVAGEEGIWGGIQHGIQHGLGLHGEPELGQAVLHWGGEAAPAGSSGDSNGGWGGGGGGGGGGGERYLGEGEQEEQSKRGEEQPPRQPRP